ncbi:Ni/Fe hydrogenase subunit alpha [bacterium]|nr:Ni/Fe hydrogenase subunit alpha [bacterium]
MKIKINHISRVEGHIGFVGHLLNGQVRKAKIDVFEGMRLIEGILIGRHFSEAPIITSRICGVCPVIHNITAIKAIENALQVKPSQKTVILRKLMLYGQIIQSHALHLFFLSLPDFLNYPDDITLIKKYPKQAQIALDIRRFANKLIYLIGGRSIHPINSQIAGFKMEPNIEKVKKLYFNSRKILTESIDLANFFKKLDYPKFERKTNFVSLCQKNEYAIYDGKIKVKDKKRKTNIFSAKKFLDVVREIIKYSEVVKRVRYKDQTYMVGALARINNQSNKLNKEAKKILKGITKERLETNTFYNIFAQAVEVVHFVEESRKLLDKLIRIRNKPLKNKNVRVKAGQGLAICEAPRGILVDYFEIDKNGIIKNCNIITPTAQFLNNIEEDLKIWLPNLKKLSKKERERKIKMLIRAYDPCISCAVH